MRVTKKLPLSPPLSKDKELTDIGHSMSIANLILGINSVTVSYLIHYHNLLQKATATLLKNAIEVYYKMRQVFSYKMQQFYHKMRQLLQSATILLQNATVITKSDVITNCDSTIILYTISVTNITLE